MELSNGALIHFPTTAEWRTDLTVAARPRTGQYASAHAVRWDANQPPGIGDLVSYQNDRKG